jgi:hypothetical protein
VCGSKGSSTTSSTFTPPAGVQANYDYLSNQAKSVASTPFQQYAGQMVAPMTPEQQAGIGQINASANLAQPYFEAATGYEQQGATPFGQQALNQYMSPYINSVANSTLANLNETNAQQQQQVLGNNITRGAFGGDRSQIAQAELARQQGLATGQTMAGIYQGGFNQAEQQFNADQARRMAAGQTLGGFGTAAQTAAMQGGQAMLGAGAQEQAYQQALDTANQQQFQAAQAYPFQTTQFLGNLLLGIGGQSGGTSLTSQPGPNVGSQLLGGLMTLGSIPWGSDERLKENMEPVGKTFDGQNIYKFNYKNDGRTMLGLSAQEVEKHKPEAVHKDDQGMRSVDYETAVNGAAKRGHFADGGVPDWMGGAVHEGLGRAHYATAGSVGDIPYTSQPSGGTGTAPLTLKDLMPLAALISQGQLGGKLKFPDAPKPFEEGTMMDVAKQLQGMSSEQRANMKSNIGSIGNIINPPITVPGTAIGQSQGTYSLGLPYASGGVAARGAYKDGQTVQTPPDTMPDQAAPDQTTPSSSPLSSLGNILPSKGQSIIEKATGLDLSDNARMGMLAAGLGMLSSRSPFFGVGVGEGATAGLGAYYNAKANDRAYEKQQRELELTQQERNTQQQMADIAKGKSPSEIALANANAIEAIQRAKASAGTMYEKTWVAGEGWQIYDKNNPFAPPIKITDDQGNPLGSIDPATIPNKGATVVNPSVSTGEPIKASKAATPPVANPVVLPKPPEEPTKTTEWKPVTTVPAGYKYPGQYSLANTPDAMKDAQASAIKTKTEQAAKAQGAFDTLYSLDNMDRSFNDVSKTGLLAPGQHVDERTNFAVGVNTMASILGGKPIFDPTDVANLEELAKDNKRLGFALSRALGSREPGFIVQQAISANPSAANTPLGFHRITEALRQGAEYERDRNAFYDSYKAKFLHLEGAEKLFAELNPPQKYADRAIVNSIDATHLSEIRQWAEANKGKDLSAGRAQFDKIYGTNAFKLATGQ